MPILSIVIPTYNMSAWLPAALESCLWQDSPDYEVIVVNDGSTDASGAIADHYSHKHSRIRVVHQANAGLGAARQAGQDAAAGDYITWLDADDFLAPQAVRLWLAKAERDAVPMVCANAVAFSSRTFNARRYFYHPQASRMLFGDSPRYWKSKVVWRWIFSLPFIRAHGLTHPHFKLSQDICFMYEALVKEQPFSQVEEYLYFFRQEHKSAHASLEVEVEHNLRHFPVVKNTLLAAGYPKVLVKYLNENYLRDLRKLLPRMTGEDAVWVDRTLALGGELFAGVDPAWFEAAFLEPEVRAEAQMANLARLFAANDIPGVRRVFDSWREQAPSAPNKENIWHTLRHKIKSRFNPLSRQSRRMLRRLEASAAQSLTGMLA